MFQLRYSPMDRGPRGLVLLLGFLLLLRPYHETKSLVWIRRWVGKNLFLWVAPRMLTPFHREVCVHVFVCQKVLCATLRREGTQGGHVIPYCYS